MTRLENSSRFILIGSRSGSAPPDGRGPLDDVRGPPRVVIATFALMSRIAKCGARTQVPPDLARPLPWIRLEESSNVTEACRGKVRGDLLDGRSVLGTDGEGACGTAEDGEDSGDMNR
jgi:hypothetical protein